MTRVRLDYLPIPPGRHRGACQRFAYEDLVIEIEGIAYVGKDKQRLMPANHWDWSIPVPMSQGWKVGDYIFVGGQVSADSKGRAIGAATSPRRPATPSNISARF